MKATLNFDKLNSLNPKIKYGFTKELLKIGASKPALLYDYFDVFVPLLKEKNNILKWTGLDLIGYLSAVDRDNKVDYQIPVINKLLHGGQLITSNHAIFSLGLIAQNKPDYKFEIIKELLQIDKGSFDTIECKNITIGKVLDVFNQLINDIKDNKAAIRFIQKATENDRVATRKKAIKLINKIKKQKKNDFFNGMA